MVRFGRSPRSCREHAWTGVESLEPRIVLSTVLWDGGPSGTGTDWHEPTNWDGDAVPGPGDDVVINVAADPEIVYSNGALSLASLTTAEALRVTAGTLEVTGAADVDNELTLAGGTLRNGNWDVTGGALKISGVSGSVLDDMVINGDIDLDQVNARVRVEGTTSWTTANLHAANASLGFEPGISVAGDIRFGGSDTGTRFLEMNGSAGTLTFPAGVTVSTDPGFQGSGRIGAGFWFGGAMTLVQQGTVDVDGVVSRTFTFNPASLINSGTIAGDTIRVQLLNGLVNTGAISMQNGLLELDGAWDNSNGTVSIADGTLHLDGSFQTSQIGTINRFGTTTVELAGELDNASDTLTLDGTTGSWVLLGGSVSGGQLSGADGQHLAIGASTLNRLTDVQINNDLVLDLVNGRVRLEGSTSFATARLAETNTSLSFEPGTVIPGDISLEGVATGTRYLELDGTPGTLTLPAGRSITTAAGFAGSLRIGSGFWFGGGMTLVNDGTIDFTSLSNRLLTLNPVALVNNGTISSDTSALDLSTALVNNNLIAQIDNTLDLDGTWDNSAGTMSITDGTLHLDGVFQTSQIGSITRTGSTTVELAGDLDNSGDTLAFSNATGTWVLLNGSVSGGQITSADGHRLAVGASSINRLDDVLVVGDLILDRVNARVRIEGATSFTTARLSEVNNSLLFEPGTTVPGNISLEGTNGFRYVELNGSPGTLTLPAGQMIMSAAGFNGSARIGAGFWGGGAMTLVNNGTLNFTSLASQAIHVDPASFVNNGTVSSDTAKLLIDNALVNNGTIAQSNNDLEVDGTWDNSAGTLSITEGTLELDGTFQTSHIGTITRSGATTVELTGDLDNTGDTLSFDAASGSWVLIGGSVTGGQVDGADGERLHISANTLNRLDNVQFTHELVLDEVNSRVRLEGATTYPIARLANTNATLSFEPDATVASDISVEGPGTGMRGIELNGTSGMLTVGSGATISTAAGFAGTLRIGAPFWFAGTMTLVNDGNIELDSDPSRTHIIRGDTITNNGSITSEVAEIQIDPDTLINNGTLRAHEGGTIAVDLDGTTFTNDGTIEVAPDSQFEVADDLVLSSGATLNVEISGTGSDDIGFVDVAGTATIGGTINVLPVNGWTPECMNSDFLIAATVTGGFATTNLPLAPAGHQSLIIFPGSDTIRFAISSKSDWNQDGILTTQDFLDFLNDWVAQEPQADFNNDTLINTADFLAFLNSYVAGC